MGADDSPLALAARTSEPQPEMSREDWEWQRDLWPKVKGLHEFLDIYVFNHIKYFDASTHDEDPTNVYMEREWRVLGHVNFALSDVHRVFLPEAFAECFRNDLPDIGELNFSDGGN